MAAMTKIVNIRTRVAVRNVNPPISGSVKGIVMTTGDILKCLCKRAQVEEVLPNGTTVKLNMRNYYTDNGAGLNAKKNLPVEEKKPVENPARFKVPVAPTEKVKEQVVETKTEEVKPVEDAVVADVVESAEAEAPAMEIIEEAPSDDDLVAEDEVEVVPEGTNAGGVVGCAEDSDVAIETSNNTNSTNNNHNNGKKHKHKK